MADRIYDYFFNKFSDLFPVGGGAVGATSQISKISSYPTWEFFIKAICIAFIGAIIGYLVKLLFDIIFKKFKKKHDIL